MDDALQLGCAAAKIHFQIDAGIPGHFAFDPTAQQDKMQGGQPVSYTHLDVYKRQVQDRWETLK